MPIYPTQKIRKTAAFWTGANELLTCVESSTESSSDSCTVAIASITCTPALQRQQYALPYQNHYLAPDLHIGKPQTKRKRRTGQDIPCPVCLSKGRQMIELSCHHYMCRVCCDGMRAATCPVCRGEFNFDTHGLRSKELHRMRRTGARNLPQFDQRGGGYNNPFPNFHTTLAYPVPPYTAGQCFAMVSHRFPFPMQSCTQLQTFMHAMCVVHTRTVMATHKR